MFWSHSLNPLAYIHVQVCTVLVINGCMSGVMKLTSLSLLIVCLSSTHNMHTWPYTLIAKSAVIPGFSECMFNGRFYAVGESFHPVVTILEKEYEAVCYNCTCQPVSTFAWYLYWYFISCYIKVLIAAAIILSIVGW